MSDAVQGGVVIITAIIGLAALAVFFGSQQTAPVIQAGGTALSTLIQAAVAPVASTQTGIHA